MIPSSSSSFRRVAESQGGLERLDEAELDGQEGDAELRARLEDGSEGGQCCARVAFQPEHLRLVQPVGRETLPLLGRRELCGLLEPRG